MQVFIQAKNLGKEVGKEYVIQEVIAVIKYVVIEVGKEVVYIHMTWWI